MRKLFLTAVAVLMLTVAYSQDEKGSIYKPNQGDITADFGINGGLLNTVVGYNNGVTGSVLKGRYFLENNMALRAKFAVNSNSVKNEIASDTDKSSSLGLDLGVGIEKHFAGTSRLSPYVGGELMIGYVSQSTENTAVKTETKGPNTFSFGVNGVFGADYYFVRNVYLGLEGGLGIGMSNTGESETTVGGTTTKSETTSSAFNISPVAVGAVRIGFVF